MEHKAYWDQLQFLLAVARARTFSGAARALGVNHTTVARQVRALETYLGAELIERGDRGFSLTPSGDQAVATAQRVEQELATLELDLLGADARLSGRLSVATFDAIATELVDEFAQFQRRYPGIELEIASDLVPISLARREADVAIRAANSPPEHLIGRRVFHYAYALYGHRELAKRPVGDLEDYPWIGWDPRVGARITDRWMQRNVPDARVPLRVNTMPMMLAALEQGLGIAFVPCLTADVRQSLQRLLPIDPEFGVDIWLLTPPELRRTARVRAFMDHFEAAFSRLPKPRPDRR